MNTITLAPGLTLIHGDCMEYLATLPDGAVDLAVVDPPYGIGFDGEVDSMVTSNTSGKWKGARGKAYKHKEWDKEPPPREYFSRLLRASRSQVIWGGNYFELPPSGGWIVWDKIKPPDFSLSQAELAWVSHSGRVAIFRYLWHGFQKAEPIDRIHPTQKPVALYRWLLQNYAKPGQTILDTHLGSGSSAIAAWEMGYTFTGIEIDKDYFDAAVERISKRLLSPYLPGIAGNEGKGQAEQVKLFCD